MHPTHPQLTGTGSHTVPVDTNSAIPAGAAEPVATLPVDMTPADVLRAAALYLERHGWTQYLLYESDQPFPPACAMGAVRMTVLGDPLGLADIPNDTDTALVNRVLRYLAGYIDADFDAETSSAMQFIGEWNDDRDRTKPDVVSLLRDAADEWDRIHRGAR
jgi:hypothetical protein